jgi:putative colanic acid biosynthesis acetyltransferase WcaF
MNAETGSRSKVRLSEFNAGDFSRGASTTKEMLWYLTKVVFFLSALPYPNSLKASLLRLFGARVGKALVIKPRVNIHFPWKLNIGDHVWIGEEAFLLNFEKLTIGSNVCISQRSMLCGGNHNYKDPSMPFRNQPITLLDGSWIGACCFVGPGVTVGYDSVITAGSIVTSDIDDHGIYKGDPAVFIKQRW